MRHLRLAASLFGLLLLVEAAPAQGQITASLAAVRTTLAVEKAGCWGCNDRLPVSMCMGGQAPGYWNCIQTLFGGCTPSSPGCGAGALLPLDADGATQYVSRGQAMAVTTGLSAEWPEYRNCEGILVACWQDGMQIANVRARTATLTL